jgi:ketosteroid isomerase-like protein
MTTALEHAHLATARRYLELLEQWADPSEFETIFHPNIVQEEFPNLLMPQGQRRTLDGLYAGMNMGKQILSSQHYDVRNAFASGDWVTLEVVWTGTLSKDVGKLPAGKELRAYISTILQFQDGRIIAQRNYDCYEPF